MTDLAWLNDMDLAKLLCQSPVPIFTGIGHERDNTILDEIAHTRFDTPSKVALHISTTIKDNALAAIQAWERINALVGRIILRERTMPTTQADRIQTGVRAVMRRVESEQEGFIKLIRAAITAQVREASIALETQQDRLIDGAETAMLAPRGQTEFQVNLKLGLTPYPRTSVNNEMWVKLSPSVGLGSHD